jgi:hypothetical protein
LFLRNLFLGKCVGGVGMGEKKFLGGDFGVFGVARIDGLMSGFAPLLIHRLIGIGGGGRCTSYHGQRGFYGRARRRGRCVRFEAARVRSEGGCARMYRRRAVHCGRVPIRCAWGRKRGGWCSQRAGRLLERFARNTHPSGRNQSQCGRTHLHFAGGRERCGGREKRWGRREKRLGGWRERFAMNAPCVA